MSLRLVTNNVAIVLLNYTGTFYSEKSTLMFLKCFGIFIINKTDNQWKVIHSHKSIQESAFVETKFV